MKIYFNTNGTISRIESSVLVQNSGNYNYIYIYGITAEVGLTVKVSYERPDRRKAGPYLATSGTDDDDVACFIARIPAEALTVDGGLQIYILTEKEFEEVVGGETVTSIRTQAYIGIAATVFPNGSVVGP